MEWREVFCAAAGETDGADQRVNAEDSAAADSSPAASEPGTQSEAVPSATSKFCVEKAHARPWITQTRMGEHVWSGFYAIDVSSACRQQRGRQKEKVPAKENQGL